MRFSQPIIKALFGLTAAGILTLTPAHHTASDQNETHSINTALTDWEFHSKNPSFRDMSRKEALRHVQMNVAGFCAKIPKTEWDNSRSLFEQKAGALCHDRPDDLNRYVAFLFNEYASVGLDAAGKDAPMVEGHSPLPLDSPLMYLGNEYILRINDVKNTYEEYNKHNNKADVQKGMHEFLKLASGIKDPLIKLLAVNKYINTVIKYDNEKLDNVANIPDNEWVDPIAKILKEKNGVCVDHATLKAQVLLELGFPPDDVWVLGVRKPGENPHAVLGVKTSQGLYILNNISLPDEILPLSENFATLAAGRIVKGVDFFGTEEPEEEIKLNSGYRLEDAYNPATRKIIPYAALHDKIEDAFVESNYVRSPSFDADFKIIDRITVLAIAEHNTAIGKQMAGKNENGASRPSTQSTSKAVPIPSTSG